MHFDFTILHSHLLKRSFASNVYLKLRDACSPTCLMFLLTPRSTLPMHQISLTMTMMTMTAATETEDTTAFRSFYIEPRAFYSHITKAQVFVLHLFLFSKVTTRYSRDLMRELKCLLFFSRCCCCWLLMLLLLLFSYYYWCCCFFINVGCYFCFTFEINIEIVLWRPFVYWKRYSREHVTLALPDWIGNTKGKTTDSMQNQIVYWLLFHEMFNSMKISRTLNNWIVSVPTGDCVWVIFPPCEVHTANK